MEVQERLCMKRRMRRQMRYKEWKGGWGDKGEMKHEWMRMRR
jgi:hypothetical protein